MKQKLTSTIAGASIFIALISLISRGIGFIREIVFAGYFGTGEAFDLYLVGAAIPVTISTAIYYIGQNFFIPAYNHILINKKNDLNKFITNSFFLFIVAGIVITMVLYAAADQIINLFLNNGSGLQREIAGKVFKIFIFTIPFSAGVAVLAAYFNSVYEFKYPSLSFLVLNIFTVIFVFLFGEKEGVLIIAIGYLTGSVLQFLYLFVRAKLKINFTGLLLVLSKNREDAASIVNFSFISIILIEIISQLFILFDRYFYGEVNSGGIAALNYAQNIFLLPVSILSMALATAVFPKLTSSLVNRDSAGVRLIFIEAGRIIILIFIPLSFIFIFYSEEVVSIIFRRGNFTSVSTAYTASVLMYFSSSLVFYAVYSVINKIFYSAGLIKTLLVLTIAGSLIKLALNYSLVQSMEQNGLAAASAITYIFLFLSSFLILNFKLKLKIFLMFFIDFTWMLVAAIFAYLISGILTPLISGGNILKDVIFVVIFISVYILNINLINPSSLKVIRDFYSRVLAERRRIKF